MAKDKEKECMGCASLKITKITGPEEYFRLAPEEWPPPNQILGCDHPIMRKNLAHPNNLDPKVGKGCRYRKSRQR